MLVWTVLQKLSLSYFNTLIWILGGWDVQFPKSQSAQQSRWQWRWLSDKVFFLNTFMEIFVRVKTGSVLLIPVNLNENLFPFEKQGMRMVSLYLEIFTCELVTYVDALSRRFTHWNWLSLRLNGKEKLIGLIIVQLGFYVEFSKLNPASLLCIQVRSLILFSSLCFFVCFVFYFWKAGEIIVGMCLCSKLQTFSGINMEFYVMWIFFYSDSLTWQNFHLRTG